MKILSVLAKMSWKTVIELCHSALFHRKTRVCLKYFVNHCPWKQFLDSNCPHSTSRILRNQEISGKCRIFIEILPSRYPPSRNESFVNTSKNLLKYRNRTFAVVHYFTWKLELASSALLMIVGVLTWIWMFSEQLQLVLGRFWLIVDDIEWWSMV